jgi:hypothetical protein
MHIDSLEKGGVTNGMQYDNNRSIVEAAARVNVFVADDPSALYLLHKAGSKTSSEIPAPRPGRARARRARRDTPPCAPRLPASGV